MNNSAVPQLFALLSNNTAATYDRFFSTLLEMCLSCRPACIMIDFEKVSMRTFLIRLQKQILLDAFSPL